MSDIDIKECSDSGCILLDRSKPTGMRTNGGCKHLTGSPNEMRKLLKQFGIEIVNLRKKLILVEKERDELKIKIETAKTENTLRPVAVAVDSLLAAYEEGRRSMEQDMNESKKKVE